MEKVRTEYKIIILGDSGVGKTCILNQIAHGEFLQNVSSTFGTLYLERIIRRPDGTSIKLRLFDTAGQERFMSIARGNYTAASLALLTFDVTNKESFDRVKAWIDDVKEHSPDEIMLYIVGNKTDLSQQQVIDRDQAQELADKVNAHLKLVSAKEGSGIPELVNEIVDLVDPITERPVVTPENKNDDKRKSIKLTNTQPEKTKKKCC